MTDQKRIGKRTRTRRLKKSNLNKASMVIGKEKKKFLKRAKIKK